MTPSTAQVRALIKRARREAITVELQRRGLDAESNSHHRDTLPAREIERPRQASR